MRARKVIRWTVVTAVALVCFVLLALVTFQFWFPWILKPVAASFGFTYKEYHRLENGRFSIQEAQYQKGRISAQAQEIKGFHPLAWARMISRGETNQTNFFLEISGWKARALDEETTAKPSQPPVSKPGNPPAVLFRKVDEQLKTARKWVPRALVSNGTVEVRGKEYALGAVLWERGKITADLTWPELVSPADIKIDLSEELPYDFIFQVYALDVRSKLTLTPETNGFRATGYGIWKTNRADLEATFSGASSLPVTARLRSKGFNVPAAKLKLKGYQDVTTVVDAIWETNGFQVDLSANALPEPKESASLPPLNVLLKAAGTTQSVTISRLDIQAPGIKAELEQPLSVRIPFRLPNQSARFRFSALLEQLPWVALRGSVAGEARLSPGAGEIPALEFQLRGDAVEAFGLPAAGVKVAAAVHWPELEVQPSSILFTNGAKLEFKAAGNWEEKRVRAAEASFSGALSLPMNGYSFSNATVKVKAFGGYPNIQHTGKIELEEVRSSQFQPVDLQAAWEGEYLSLSNFTAQARTAGGDMQVAGMLQFDKTNGAAVIQQFYLQDGKTRLALDAPAQFQFQPATNGMQLKLDNFGLKGPGGELLTARLDGQWPRRFTGEVQAARLAASILQPFLKKPVPELFIEQATWKGGFEEGPLEGTLSLQVAFRPPKAPFLFQARAQSALKREGVELGECLVATEAGDVLNAQGTLPILLWPGRPERRYEFLTNQTVNFSARTAPNAAFWEEVARLTGVQLENPAIRLEASGPAKNPALTGRIEAAAIAFAKITNTLPRIEAVTAEWEANQQKAVIRELTMQLEGEPVQLRGEVALGDAFWQRPAKQRLAHIMNHAEAQVRADRLRVERFAKFMPQMLAPEGAISMDLGIAPGFNLAGQVIVTNVLLRPLPKIGTVENVSARLHFDGRRFQLQDAVAHVGGQPLRAGGEVDLSSFTFEKEKFQPPLFRLDLKGENVPLTRQAEIILRSDFQVTVAKTNEAPARVTGEATLRDSVLVSDLTALAPGRVVRPEQRPPFFSIEKEPLASWLLDVRVRGDHFLKVRSPFFKGEVSANFHLQGNLREPLASGEAAIDSGLIQFPFGSLRVTQGLVTLNRADPDRPQLYLLAESRTFGYDIKLEVTGPADDPVAQFSSIPALSSEQIVLMLTAGQLPRNELSFSGQQKASTLGLFVGRGLWSKFGGGDPGGERFTLRSGENISEQGRPTYQMEYKLNEDWALVGEYDRFGALNAGVKWKFFSR